MSIKLLETNKKFLKWILNSNSIEELADVLCVIHHERSGKMVDDEIYKKVLKDIAEFFNEFSKTDPRLFFYQGFVGYRPMGDPYEPGSPDYMVRLDEFKNGKNPYKS